MPFAELSLQGVLDKLKRRESLEPVEMEFVMQTLMSGSMADALIEEFLVRLKAKGETAREIAAAARVMRKNCLKLSRSYPDLIDTCGTGGDGRHSLNISTLAALVVSSLGVAVAKHGNRSVSSVCGSADLLEMLGVPINLKPPAIEASIEKFGFGFFFAPNFHPATRFAMPARKKIQGKTIFNLLGPLSNPAGATRQIIGVYEEGLVKTLAEVLKELGVRHALVVHSQDGLDEISPVADTAVAEVKASKIEFYTLRPEEAGFSKEGTLEDLRCKTKEEAKAKALKVLGGEKGLAGAAVSLNAAAALFVAGRVSSIREGVPLAQKAMEEGRALRHVEALAEFAGRPVV
ncbi:MAG: anthranilate phosphoribosyltransferase [Candidatus Omnitrophica bacterium]|nr:anthranilate phosphoribosyltransferase [Candidatus Omnitrophota bacterium]